MSKINISIEDLENIMKSNNLTIRAIPQKTTGVYEASHLPEYPDGVIKYDEARKREMLFVEKIPKNAGKFIIEVAPHTDTLVKFSGKEFFNSIEEAVSSFYEF